MKSNSCLVGVVFALSVCTGCTISIKHDPDHYCYDQLHCKSKERKVSPGIVHIGGSVENPQSIEIPEVGLSLAEALIRVRVSDRQQIHVVGSMDDSSGVLGSNSPRSQASDQTRALTPGVVLATLNQLELDEPHTIEDIEPGLSDLIGSEDDELPLALSGGSGPVVADEETETEAADDPDDDMGDRSDGEVLDVESDSEIQNTGEDGGRGGATSSEFSDALEKEMFVAIERTVLGVKHFYHFPMDSVVRDVAGQIALRDGDLVRITPASGSGLESEVGAVSDKFSISVTGLVGTPRVLGDNSGFDDHGLDTLISDRKLVQPSEDWTHIWISRPSHSGLAVNHFLIGRDSHLRSSIYLHSQDNVVFTQLGLVPMVQTGIMEVARRPRRKELLNTQQTLRSRIQDRTQSMPVVEPIRRWGRALTNQIRSGF